MKTNLGRLIWVIIPMVVCLPTAAHAALFSNFATDLNTRLNPGIDEIGDEVILAGGPPGANYNITSFSFYYWAEFLGVNATMEVRFYKNDGAFGAPFSKIFDSTAFSINDTFGAGGLNTARSLVTFDTDFGAGLLAPGDFTWTIQFSNLGGGTAGVDLFSPPTVGNDYVDYWHNTGSTWEALTFGGSPNADFAASFDGEAAVPEPSGWVVNGLLGAGGVGAFLRLLWRRRRADSNSTAEA